MRFLLYISFLFIASCSTHLPDVQVDPIVVQKPQPIQVAKVKWHVIDSYVCLSATDGVKFNVQQKDTIRYIKELKFRLCILGEKQYCEEKINE